MKTLTLIINGLESISEAKDIADNHYGSMRWSREEDGVIRAYPYSSGYPCEIITKQERTDESDS